MILPASWAITQFRDEENLHAPSRVFLSGLLIGVALLFKYPVILWLPAIAVAVCYYGVSKHRTLQIVPALALLLIGFAIPPAATYGYFASKGGEQELVYWLFKNNLGYSANPIVFREASGRAFSSLLPFLIATSPLWWFSFWRSTELSGTRRVLLWSLILFTVPAAFWGFRFYPHYFIPFYVPLALCSAPAVSEIWARRSKLFLIYSAVLFAGFTIANCFLYFGSDVYQERNPAFRNVAERIRRDSRYGGATLFAWGYAPIVYYYTRLPAASRFVVLPQSGLTSYISGNLESVRGNVPVVSQFKRDHWDWLIADLDKNRATYILDFSPSGIYRWNRYPMKDYPLLQNYVNLHFDHLDEVDGIVIYRRKPLDTRD